MIGRSHRMIEIFDLIDKVADCDSTILINGETGSGKGLVARAIHNKSRRRSKPFISINCGAIPENLLESELFGHVKGAFTGATASKPGKFELADGGTVFLDEIGDMSPDLQVKVLKVLEEGEFEQVGGSKTIKVDVRIIAATHRDLSEEVQKANFREDLFYRLYVIPMTLPSLRERTQDIPLLISYPGQIKPGTVIHEALNNVDFKPTILALMGVWSAGGDEGRDASALFRTGQAPAGWRGPAARSASGYNPTQEVPQESSRSPGSSTPAPRAAPG